MIVLGVSSWLFDAWRGVFYPDSLARGDYLAYYSRYFATVEVNTSFYGRPRQSTVAKWLAATPDGFQFCLKFPRAISHEKQLVDCQAETRSFLDLLRLLGDAAAPAFLQLPPGFTRAGAGRTLADYLAWLAEAGRDLRLAVEVRAADLMTPAFVAYLLDLGLAPVLVDRVNTPDLYPAYLALLEAGKGPRYLVIRWIGDDANGPTGDREITAPRDAELAQWAERLATLHRAGIDVFGYMHNPYEGHSPASVRRLQAELARYVDLPAWQPPLEPEDAPPGQLSLFS